MNVVVIGGGKMGLPLAVQIASRGGRVTVADINVAAVEAINRGECPIDEPGVPDRLARLVASGYLKATTDTEAAVGDAQVVIVIVPVLLTREFGADLGTIESVSRQLARALRPGSLVSFETTLPVGTTRRLGEVIGSGGLRAGRDFALVFSPERVKSQKVLERLMENPKVVGGLTPGCERRGVEFYAHYLGAPVVPVGSLETAELVKLCGMVYRDVNIALSNELAAYCTACGADFERVREAANTDGEASLLLPGIGVGGHCTPVYPYFVINDARTRQLPVPLTRFARDSNESQPETVLQEFVRAFGSLEGVRVVILGLGFRPEVKEHVCSPAFDLARVLRDMRADVSLNDPLYGDAELVRMGFRPGRVDEAEVLVLNTAHAAFANLDWPALAARGLRGVLDGRRAWEPDAIVRAGVFYWGVGFPRTSAPVIAPA